jgi:hypothetical protein
MATPISDADLRAVAERCNWSPAAVSRALGRGAKPPGSLGVRLRALRVAVARGGDVKRDGGGEARAQEGTETRLVVPDRHGKAMDPRAWKILKDVARDLRPDRVIVMGDFLDMASLSHHPKREPDTTRFVDEIDEGKQALDELQEAARPDDTDFLEGNHCGWARSFMAENPNLVGALDVAKNLRLEERGIRWVSLYEQDNFQLGPVAYCHGLSESRHHAMAHANDFGPTIGCKHVVYAHMHTFQSFTSKAGYTARCCGFLGDEKNVAFAYKKGRPAGWQLGFLIQEVSGTAVTDTEVRIVNGEAVFRGRVYRG